MSDTNASNGTGITLTAGGVSVGQIEDITPPEYEGGAFKVTNHQTTGKFHEYRPNRFVEGGEFKVVMIYTAEQHATMVGIINELVEFVVTYDDNGGSGGTSDTFIGILTKIGKTSPFENAMKSSITIKVAGDVVTA